MYTKTILAAIVAIIFVTGAFAQNDIAIKRITQTKIPGMETIPQMTDDELAQMPPAARERIRNMGKRETAVYIKGSRMRTDFKYDKPSGYKMTKVTQTTIDQCDKRRTISFDDQKKQYTVSVYGGQAKGPEPAAAAVAPAKSKKPATKGVINVEVTSVDTGERMKLFGYNARRIKQTTTITPVGSPCIKSPLTVKVDGWYADLPTYSCPLDQREPPKQGFESGCESEIRSVIKGVVDLGIPLKEVRTITADGKTIETIDEVVELTNTSLSTSLFEPPAGYVPADKNAIENDSAAAPDTMPAAPAATTAPAPAGNLNTTTIAEKKPGTMRIGLAAPVADMGAGYDPSSAGAGVRNTILVALKTDTVEPVFIDSSLTEQEARQKGCDYILYTKVTRKKGGGLFGSMAPMIVGTAAGLIPGIGGVVGSMAASTVMTAATISGGFKSKDEISLEYSLKALDGTVLIPPTVLKQKVKKDGEDVLTPQIQQAAAAVAAKLKTP